MKVSYEKCYNKYLKHWVVWKNSEGERSINCISVFHGSRKECDKKLKELKNGQRGI